MISPLLANIYLHYVLDLWAERWRRREATGDMIIVRYADDLVVGFQRESDARRFLEAMRARFEEFPLSLHPDKTRLIEFGRHTRPTREKRGLGKPETFNFLGFTIICGHTGRGTFPCSGGRSRRDRMRTKLREIREEVAGSGCTCRSLNSGSWLAQIIRGYFAYHAVPTNCRGAQQRSGNHRALALAANTPAAGPAGPDAWEPIAKLADDWLPKPKSPIRGRMRASPSSTRGRSRMP